MTDECTLCHHEEAEGIERYIITTTGTLEGPYLLGEDCMEACYYITEMEWNVFQSFYDIYRNALGAAGKLRDAIAMLKSIEAVDIEGDEKAVALHTEIESKLKDLLLRLLEVRRERI